MIEAADIEEIRIFPAHISVHFEQEAIDRLGTVKRLLDAQGFDPVNERALAFVRRRREAETYSEEYGERADFYHAGRESSEKIDVAARFRSGEIPLLFATKAFGMGVDIRNIRYVFHLGPPSSIEDYIQEIGRAGRDGLPSHAYLIYADSDFGDSRTRIVNSQLSWEMVRAMQSQIEEYRTGLAPSERKSFVIPHDLIASNPLTNKALFGKDSAEVRQRMLLYSLEEAGRLIVGNFEQTHWPVALGDRNPSEGFARRIRNLAAKRGATTEYKVLIAEREIAHALQCATDSEARDQLFLASRAGAVRIPLDVALEWTRWAQSEDAKAEIDAIQPLAAEFLRDVKNMESSALTISHAYAHPDYLNDSAAKRRAQEHDRIGVRFDERKVYIVRFLRRVAGLRVTHSAATKAYTIHAEDAPTHSDLADWRTVLAHLPERAAAVISHLMEQTSNTTVGALYNAASSVAELSSLAELELTLAYLAALGLVRLSSELIPTSVRIDLNDRDFTAPFNTAADDTSRHLLNERNRLRLLRLDALQTLTRISDAPNQERFSREFFEAASVDQAREAVLRNAAMLDNSLHQQFDGLAIKAYFDQLTPEQQSVVRAAQNQNLVVQAGPGTGKTHTLILCIVQRLLASDAIASGRNPNGPIAAPSLLVLAYTRAVVEELRDRLRRHLKTLGRNETPLVHTFHSYAMHRLAEAGRRDIELNTAIPDFVTAFRGGKLPGAPVHIFVDEFQDITDERLLMLQTILSSSTGELITVIGDPDQSIYDYGNASPDRASSETLFAEFAASHHAQSLPLTINFRSDRQIVDAAASIFQRSLVPQAQAGEGNVTRAPATEGMLAKETLRALSSYRQTAVLFRTNSELYSTLAELRAVRDAEDKVAFRILGGQGRIVRSREINETLERLKILPGETPCTEQLVEETVRQVWSSNRILEARFFRHILDGCWLFLQGERGPSIASFIDWTESDLNGEHLVYASRTRRSEEDGRELVLSTMHRTKGLEFDAVIVAPSDMSLRLGDIDEERRLRYVAITRARHMLTTMDGPREVALASRTAWDSPDPTRARRFDTIDREGSGAFRLSDLFKQQEYLLNCIQTGDPLVIDKRALWHNGHRLCSLSARRASEIQDQTLEGIYVSEIIRYDPIDSADGSSAPGKAPAWRYILNAAGYLRPRIG